MFLKFDAFVFRVDADPFEVLQHIESLEFSLVQAVPKYGYRYCYNLELGGISHGIVQYGGDSVGTGVYVSILGASSGRVRDYFLTLDFPCYLLRADIALDFNGSKYFKKISKDLVVLAKQKGLKTSTVGDWVQGIGGRTLYVGSRSSTFMIRLYEKYKQKGIDTEGEETIRLEMEIKPYKHARLESFTLTALQLVSSSSIYSPIYQKYLKLTEGISMSLIRKDTDHEKALAHMIKQYQNTLKKQLAIDGGCVDTLFRTLTTHEDWKK